MSTVSRPPRTVKRTDSARTTEFAAWLESQAAYCRSVGNKSADWVAAELEAAAVEARLYHAETAAEFELLRSGERDSFIAEIREQGRAAGYNEGFADASGAAHSQVDLDEARHRFDAPGDVWL
jgi:flagellar biosynthesis/type III secretory pathway protein FliH